MAALSLPRAAAALGLSLACAAAPLASHGSSRPEEASPESRLELRRTDRRLAGSADPIWELRLQLPNGSGQGFEALVGRAHRQSADRHRLGSQAPLPPGRYRLAALTPLNRLSEPNLPGELGDLLWIGLDPQFRTDRRGLGIHHDPSAGRTRESGTDGCIGLIRAHDLSTLASLMERHRPSELMVLH
jgi:hypothetical protein